MAMKTTFVEGAPPIIASAQHDGFYPAGRKYTNGTQLVDVPPPPLNTNTLRLHVQPWDA